MPTLLDAHMVHGALSELPGWSGDPTALEASFTLPPELAGRLRAEVAISADAMDHHPLVTDVPGGLTFRLSTHSAGGVTELDLALASRISDLARQLTGSPRRAARHEPQDAAGAPEGGPGAGPGAGQAGPAPERG